MSEVWKALPGHVGVYEVSDLGRVKRVERIQPDGRRVSEKILRQTPNGDGHLQVSICQRLQTVHSLVLLTFVGPRPFDGAHGRHLDDDPSNNALGNLAWGTPVQNAQDRDRHGYRAKDPARAARIAAKLRALLLLGKVTYKDMAQVASEFGVCPKTVRRIMVKLGDFPIDNLDM